MFSFYSEIKEIHFPTILKELKEEWCSDIRVLNKIIISPKNGQFMMKEEKYLIGKSDPNKDEFDKLLFGSRDIDEISLPPNIKIISPSSFHNCSNQKLQKLMKVHFHIVLI